MTTTPNMSLVLPTPGGDSGSWDDLLNAALTLVDSHDHTTGKGPQIPSAALNINANVSLGGYSLTSVGTLDFAESTITSGARRLFFSTADHELYVRTNGGTNVKITNGSSLNLSIVGGIVGDYASTGAEVAYNDANDRYTFKQETGGGGVKQWATLAGGNLDVYEQLATASATTISNRVRLSSPAALAASYALTFPAALPGSTLLMQLSSAGAITASNSVAGGLTVTSGAVDFTGASDVKMPARVLNLHSSLCSFDAATWTFNSIGPTSTGSGSLNFPIPLHEGDRITSVTFFVTGDGAADLTVTAFVRPSSTAATTNIGSATVTNPGVGGVDTTINVTDTTLAAGETVYLAYSASAANIVVGNLRVTYTRP